MVKICVSGSNGKMGKRIIALAEKDKDVKVVSAFDVGVNAAQEIKKSDVLIEFTSPQATIEHLEMVLKLKKAAVIGTTGLSEEDVDAIKKTSKKIPIVFSPNMSIGVNLLFKMCQDAAKSLSQKDYQASITEVHHVHKKDAPSGTAKRIRDILISERKEFEEEIPVASIRQGEVIGDHKVIFDSDIEKIELFHSAKSRDAFASGAIKAAKFIAGKKSGLYSMRDVLGI